jgi:hypothetical protein
LSSLSIIYDDYLEATTTLTQGALRGCPLGICDRIRRIFGRLYDCDALHFSILTGDVILGIDWIVDLDCGGAVGDGVGRIIIGEDHSFLQSGSSDICKKIEKGVRVVGSVKPLVEQISEQQLNHEGLESEILSL